MLKRQLAMIVFTLCAISTFAQVKIKGVVYNEYLEPFYNAKITSGSNSALSDISGNFEITIKGDLPQTIEISAFGHQTEYVDVERVGQKINVILKENLLLDQVVISASRVPERIIESPVTIERFGLTDIRKTTSNSFYDGLANLKGIQSRTGSYGFNSINTRGFADFSNSRFVQMVDGMDTAAPALNFSAGNLSGVNELDINNVEVLPGASSALYGANAYNGIMLMNTKNPFDFTGISTLFKTGYTSQDLAGDNLFYDLSARLAYKFSESFAAKVNFSYFEATEWLANDQNSKLIDSNEIVNIIGDFRPLDYDGVNVYGDEFNNSISVQDIGRRFFNVNLPQDARVSRTGFAERDLLMDDKSKNLKFSTSFHYRPFEDESLELILATRLAMGNNLLQGNSSRFSQRDYYIGQSKFEVKGDNFYVRTYYTRNDAGRSYNLDITGALLTARSSAGNTLGNWGVDYLIGLNNAGVDFNNLTADVDILQSAREYADSFTLQPGSNGFKTEFENITSTLITEGGSRIYDRSSYSHIDGNYNFTSLINDWADVQVGGSFRQYNPDSKGTIFNDATQPITVNEYGVYSQIQKKLLDDRLKLTASIRYDKSQNFDGNYSPRFAVNYALGEDKNHIVRASFQTGFRNPTIQEQYLFNQPGRKINVGTSRANLDRIAIGQDITLNVLGVPTVIDGVISGDDIINNSLLTETVFTDFTYVKSEYEQIKPEEVQTIELGYRSMFGITDTNNINIDVNGFYSFHNDFVFFQDIVTPKLGQVYPFGNRQLTPAELADPLIQAGNIVDGVLVWDAFAQYAFTNLGPSGELLVQEFNIVTNSKSRVNSFGASIALSTKIFESFDLGLNYSFIDFTFDDKDNGFFEPNFNTPKHTVKAQFGNNNLFKNFGFNVNARWLDKYRWVSPFVKGNVDARTVLDAQLNYRIPSIKSKFKIGGTNLLGKEFQVAPGTGNIGSLYYISWIIND
ncbi:TonB-dependent receptor domain-containing protein [uncultured Tenacibaculum sp.]|uniref:TonB-dependent receptor domain-containing protein n=1 Tax=uncultured Tenacibaculum sp. TaxID=174713 RepID=UPI002636B184|nr:TonB-dependent receptor [uncultured Tenacibaculum sp.]